MNSSRADRRPINLPFSVKAISLGDFILDREQRVEIAVLSGDGATHILRRGDLDTWPFTEEEFKAREELSDHEDEITAANGGVRPRWWAPLAGDRERWAAAGGVHNTVLPDGRVEAQSLLVLITLSTSTFSPLLRAMSGGLYVHAVSAPVVGIYWPARGRNLL